jgi:ornithine cyclodeaminase
MVLREVRREDTAIGILGTGIQARLQARMLAHVLDVESAWICGRTPERLAEFCEELRTALPRIRILAAASPAEVAHNSRLIVTATASRQWLLHADGVQPGTLILAVGSDSPGKQELEPEILRRAVAG